MTYVQQFDKNKHTKIFFIRKLMLKFVPVYRITDHETGLIVCCKFFKGKCYIMKETVL